MKYIEEYLAQQVKIKPLGKLETIIEEAEPCMPIGNRIVIDNIETDIVVWYADYSKWLEKKYDQLQQEYYNTLYEPYKNKDII